MIPSQGVVSGAIPDTAAIDISVLLDSRRMSFSGISSEAERAVWGGEAEISTFSYPTILVSSGES